MSSTGIVFGFKNLYDEQVKRLDLKVNSFSISDITQYEKIISEVFDAQNRANKKPLDYRRLKRYDVLKVSDELKLILPLNKSANHEVKYYVHNEELFDILCKSHVDTGHGGLHKMHLNLKKKYVNITRPVIQIFLANCETCSKRRGTHQTDFAIKPEVPYEAIERAQVDLINMQLCTDNEYDFVLKYQDCTSKFIILRALKTITVDEITRNLIDIFCIFGAPTVLQCDNGDKFLNGATKRLNESAWPRFKIECCKTRGSQYCRGRVHLQNHLKTWMIENNSDQWSEGLRFCQYQQNNTLHSGIQKSPFEALFGKKSKSHITSSNYVTESMFLRDNIFSENFPEDTVSTVKPDNSSNETTIAISVDPPLGGNHYLTARKNENLYYTSQQQNVTTYNTDSTLINGREPRLQTINIRPKDQTQDIISKCLSDKISLT